VKNGHAIDVLSASLDQVGVLEMWSLVKSTGGIITSCESFTQPQFSKYESAPPSFGPLLTSLRFRSISKMFEKDEKGWLKMGFNVKIEIKTSKELLVQGAIGNRPTSTH